MGLEADRITVQQKDTHYLLQRRDSPDLIGGNNKRGDYEKERQVETQERGDGYEEEK